jgi:hypothetical protein
VVPQLHTKESVAVIKTKLSALVSAQSPAH